MDAQTQKYDKRPSNIKLGHNYVEPTWHVFLFPLKIGISNKN